MVFGWWAQANMVAPLAWSMDSKNTFYLMLKSEIYFVFSLYSTNAKILWIENLIRNPKMQPSISAIRHILEFAKAFAKKLKMKMVFCMSDNRKTSLLYKRLGLVQTSENISTFVGRV